ncbi:hypothetical protein E5676_scaffold1779G00080 [Cucumis melo var. makuwa]|uniref:Uncharacterized protein n=1 Tax=Cucumis melo var. makuwa TaxID=1194695 RepID=A0A5D3CWT0_CUCMM|nr:hypothetical protein E5676_scaffold1779G00080 [Cucumis melo var. makuwa]
MDGRFDKENCDGDSENVYKRLWLREKFMVEEVLVTKKVKIRKEIESKNKEYELLQSIWEVLGNYRGVEGDGE